jgi:hypothetical protein
MISDHYANLRETQMKRNRFYVSEIADIDLFIHLKHASEKDTLILDSACTDDIRKKLGLRGDEPPANLHAAERRLDLPRRTCTITYDNGDTIFVNEVQPKSTSPKHDYGCSSPIPQHRPL